MPGVPRSLTQKPSVSRSSLLEQGAQLPEEELLDDELELEDELLEELLEELLDDEELELELELLLDEDELEVEAMQKQLLKFGTLGGEQVS